MALGAILRAHRSNFIIQLLATLLHNRQKCCWDIAVFCLLLSLWIYHLLHALDFPLHLCITPVLFGMLCWALSAFRNLLSNGLSQECQSNEKNYETNARAGTL